MAAIERDSDSMANGFVKTENREGTPQGYQGAAGSTGGVGSQGPQGPRGYQGAQGYQGAKGATGQANFEGTSGGTFTIGTGVKTFYLTGGENFKIGDFVKVVHIASPTDHWMSGYISNIVANAYDITVTAVSTTGGTYANWYVHLSGDIGPQGYQGARGYQGVTGAQGPQGATGTQGFQGAQGAQGPQGYQGAQGYQGPKGNFVIAVTNSVNANYTTTEYDEVIVCDSSVNFSVTLNDSSLGRQLDISNVNTGIVTVFCPCTGWIDGEMWQRVEQWESMTVMCVSTNKWKIT